MNGFPTFALALLLAASPALAAPAKDSPTAAAPGGRWVVAAAYPAGAVRAGEKGPVGQVMMLGATANDPAGRLCPQPVYRNGTASLEALLGGSRPSPAAEGLLPALPMVTVDCHGKLFVALARGRDGALLTRSGPWLLRLERSDKARTAKAVATRTEPRPPAAAAPPAQPPFALDTAPGLPTKGARLVYLASYRSDANALRGWAVLKKRAAALSEAQPVTRSIDIPAKGTFVRLFAAVADDGLKSRICDAIKAEAADCGAGGRN